jgi:hypothetical protein
MPKPRNVSRSIHLTKYAFPVIRSVIDRVGAPREIEKVALQQRGPLLVTLAMDISSDCINDIYSNLAVSTEGEHLPAQSLIPDLFAGLPVQGGSGFILLRKNARWWTEFAKKAEAKFGTLANSTGPLRLILRSAVANAVANDPDRKKKNGITHDAAWLEIAKKPQTFFASGRWPQIPGLRTLNEAAIRKWRSLLMDEDNRQQKWISSKAGCSHPSASSYWADGAERTAGFSAWRARNELYYCLSEGKLDWQPIFSGSFSDDDWQDWLRKADSGLPPYWSAH